MNGVIHEFNELFPGLRTVRGLARHSESNGGNEKSNRTVEERLGVLMSEYNSNHWSVLCKLAQWIINTSFHKGIKRVPYNSLTGQNPRVGLSSLPIDSKLLDQLHTEADLLEALGCDPCTRLEDATLPASMPTSVPEQMSCREEYRAALSSISSLQSDNEQLTQRLVAAESLLKANNISFVERPLNVEEKSITQDHGCPDPPLNMIDCSTFFDLDKSQYVMKPGLNEKMPALPITDMDNIINGGKFGSF